MTHKVSPKKKNSWIKATVEFEGSCPNGCNEWESCDTCENNGTRVIVL